MMIRKKMPLSQDNLKDFEVLAWMKVHSTTVDNTIGNWRNTVVKGSE